MGMQIAFRKSWVGYTGYKRYTGAITAWWTGGRYTHSELVFSDGVTGSAWFDQPGLKDGVHLVKRTKYDPDLWDLVPVRGDEVRARQWFEDNLDNGYNLIGAFGNVLRPLRGDERKFFCSQAVAAALGWKDPWRYDPNLQYAIVTGVTNIIDHDVDAVKAALATGFKKGKMVMHEGVRGHQYVLESVGIPCLEASAGLLSYREERGSTFESNGIRYDLNKIFELVEDEPVQQIDVSKLTWVLQYTDADPARVKQADLEAPILVTRYQGKELVVDGLHRLTKAVQEHRKILPYRRVSESVMHKARLEKNMEYHISSIIRLPALESSFFFDEDLNREQGGPQEVTFSSDEDEYDYVQNLDQQLTNLVDMTNDIREAEALTQEIAIESVNLLGSTDLLNTYYAGGSRAQKYQIATEGIVNKIWETINKVIESIINFLKKIADKIMAVLSGNNYKEYNVTADSLRQMESGISHVSKLTDIPAVESALAGSAPVNKFMKSLSAFMVAILRNDSVFKEVDDLFTQLQHAKIIAELDRRMDEIEAWRTRALGVAKKLIEADAKNAEAIKHPEMEKLIKEGEKLAKVKLDETGKLEQTYLSIHDAISKSMTERPIKAASDLPMIYNFVLMIQRTERAYERYTTNNTKRMQDAWLLEVKKATKRTEQMHKDLIRDQQAAKSSESNLTARVYETHGKMLKEIVEYTTNTTKAWMLINKASVASFQLVQSLYDYVGEAADHMYKDMPDEGMVEFLRLLKNTPMAKKRFNIQ